MGWGEEGALWYYTVLPEPYISSELHRLSYAASYDDSDIVSFQPCPNPEFANQDRYVLRNLPLPGGTWKLRAIFDGHAGHETADYAAYVLPGLIQQSIASILERDSAPSPSLISDALTKAIADFDKSIGDALLHIFPDKLALMDMNDDEVKSIINDDGPTSGVVLRCMRGSTALISITDPSSSNLWVASLGDSAAVIGTRDQESGQWHSTILSSSHNGENPAEADEVKRTHPNEPECFFEERVLGAIAVTRSLGDYYFKLPAVYTHRVFLNSEPSFPSPDKVRSFIFRNKTPPYLSGIPDIQHVDLASSNSSEAFLIMCSDGLMDLYDDDRLNLQSVLAPRWVGHVAAQSRASKNLALDLLRDGLGGDDTEKVSRMITVEMTFRWMDDTTILVQRLI